MKHLAFLLRHARSFARELAVISAVSVASSLAMLAVPWFAGRFIAGATGDETIDPRTNLILLVTTLIVLTVVNIAVAWLSNLAAGRILAGLRQHAYDHVQAMSVAFHERSRSGDLLALIAAEVEDLSLFLSSVLAHVPSMLMTAIGAAMLLFLLDPAMALVVPVIVPVFYIVMRLVGRRLRELARRTREAEAELMATAESDLAMLPAIKAFAVEDHHRARYHAVIERARVLALSQSRITAFISPVVSLLAALGAIAILMFGSGQIDAGTRSPADLFSFLLYAALLTRPVGELAGLYGEFQIAKGTLARLEAVLALPIEPGYTAPRRLERARGAITFEGIDFAYPGRAPVLRGFDLTVAPGEIVALTGENGIGKSTLVRLLLRFYQPDGGRITLDGQDIADLQVQELRRQFGYVPQRALLFNGTIVDNIAFGIVGPDPSRIERAARLAQAWDFIRNLPQGFQTEIGDHGIRLSGGQRQRIALARALFRDPPVYIFDEATSMYDMEGEAAFVEACIRQLTNRTVIIITHRPASLALADRIITMSASGIEQVRRHECA